MKPETYSFGCPACGATLSVPVAMAGVTGPCPYCTMEITAPPPPQMTLPLWEPAPLAPTAAVPATQPPHQPQRQAPPAQVVATASNVIQFPPGAQSVAPAAREIAPQTAAGAGLQTPPWQSPAQPMVAFHSPQAPLEEPAAAVASSAPASAAKVISLPSSDAARGRSGSGAKVAVALLLLGGIGAAAWHWREDIFPGVTQTKQDNQNPPGSATSPSAPAPPNSTAPAESTPPNATATAPPAPVAPPAEPPVGEDPIKDGKPLVATNPPPATPPDKAMPNTDAAASSPTNAVENPPVNPPPASTDEGATPEVSPLLAPGGALAEGAGAADKALLNAKPPEGGPSLITDSNPNIPAAKPVPDTPPDFASGAAGSAKVDEGRLAEPRATLNKFAAAKNWKERMQHVQAPEKIEAQMEEYYKNHADGPVEISSVDYLTSQPTPDGKMQFHLFEVNCGEEYGFPVSVEETATGCKVDWKSFVEFKDLLLPKFFERYSPEVGTFHVVLRRSHYFGSDVPNADRMIPFAVEPPVPGYTNYAWLEKESTSVLRKLGNRQEWGVVSYPVVSLRWVKDKSGAAYVTLFDVVSDNWRTDSKPASSGGAATPRAPKKTR